MNSNYNKNKYENILVYHIKTMSLIRRIFSTLRMRQPREEAPTILRYMAFSFNIVSIRATLLIKRNIKTMVILHIHFKALTRQIGLLINLMILQYFETSYRLMQLLGLMDNLFQINNIKESLKFEAYGTIDRDVVFELLDWLGHGLDSRKVDLYLELCKEYTSENRMNYSLVHNILSHLLYIINQEYDQSDAYVSDFWKQQHLNIGVFKRKHKSDIKIKIVISILEVLTFDGHRTIVTAIPLTYKDIRIRNVEIDKTMSLRDKMNIIFRIKDGIAMNQWENLGSTQYIRYARNSYDKGKSYRYLTKLRIQHCTLLSLMIRKIDMNISIMIITQLLEEYWQDSPVTERLVLKGRDEFRDDDKTTFSNSTNKIDLIRVIWSISDWESKGRGIKSKYWEKTLMTILKHSIKIFTDKPIFLAQSFDRIKHYDARTFASRFTEYDRMVSYSSVTKRDGGLIIRRAVLVNSTIIMIYIVILISVLAGGIRNSDELKNFNIDPTSLTSLVAVLLALTLQLYVSVTTATGSLTNFFKLSVDKGYLTERSLKQYGYTIPQFIDKIRDGNDPIIESCSRLGACYLPVNLDGNIQIKMEVYMNDIILGGYIPIHVAGKGTYIVNGKSSKYNNDWSEVFVDDKKARRLSQTGIVSYHMHDELEKVWGWHKVKKVQTRYQVMGTASHPSPTAIEATLKMKDLRKGAVCSKNKNKC